jgi:A/G-specific adenine glycosylase
VLLETRPGKGLLGGMLGWPGTDWTETPPDDAAPLKAHWHDPGLEVRHTFTHFHLTLRVLLAEVALEATPDRGQFHPRSTFRPASLPTVMRKAWDVAAGAWAQD